MLARLRVPALLAIGVAVGCSDSTEPIGLPAEILVAFGDGQAGTVGTQLLDQLEVRVLDDQGRAIDGAVVVFSASQGDLAEGPVAVPTANVNVVASSAPVAQVTTGVDGGASVLWTLGLTAGEQTVTASVQGVDPVEFSATAEPGPPVAVVVAGGDGQIGPPDGALSAPLVASVVDQYRNPLSGHTVDWSVSVGGGSLSNSSGQTDGSGTTSTTLTLGSTLGFNTVTASSTGLSPSDFHALALTTVWDDAVDDTFSDGLSTDRVLPDIVQVGVAWDADTLIVGLSFADSVVSTLLGGPNAMGGVVDFDVDMDSLTGIESLADRFRPGAGSTGMGVDVVVDMFADPSGEYLIFDDRQQTLGSTVAEFRGRLVAMRVPSAIIGSGPLAMAVTVGTTAEPTDLAPNDSSLVVAAGGGSPSMTPYAGQAELPSEARVWGPIRPKSP